MLSSLAALLAPTALPSPRSKAQFPPATGTQLPVPRMSTRATDAFSIVLGTTEAADIGALIGANRNVGEGASLLQVADTGLDEISDALIRMKALATSASSTTAPLSRGDRAIANAEFEALRTEVDRIADRTEFNDIKVLKGVSLAFKVGSGNASQDSITVTLSAATISGLNTNLASDTIASAAGASQALTNVTSAIDALSTLQSSVDGAAASFRTAQRNLTSGKSILSDMRTDLLERPVTIGTADYLANVTQQEFLSHAVPAAAGQLSSGARVLLASSQVPAIEPSQSENRTFSEETVQTKAANRPSVYETSQNSKSSSPNDTTHSVDIEA
ncbi:MAG: hypothetical protein E2O52_07190 [Gammaproteobacteria bacterium]|nr:MAG: hypothetical protein E2O52_07190 [Gammaproteobacteria bacterium]